MLPVSVCFSWFIHSSFVQIRILQAFRNTLLPEVFAPAHDHAATPGWMACNGLIVFFAVYENIRLMHWLSLGRRYFVSSCTRGSIQTSIPFPFRNIFCYRLMREARKASRRSQQLAFVSFCFFFFSWSFNRAKGNFACLYQYSLFAFSVWPTLKKLFFEWKTY